MTKLRNSGIFQGVREDLNGKGILKDKAFLMKTSVVHKAQISFHFQIKHAFSISGTCYVIVHNFIKSRSRDGLAAKGLLHGFLGRKFALHTYILYLFQKQIIYTNKN